MLPEVRLSMTSFLLGIATNCWVLDPALLSSITASSSSLLQSASSLFLLPGLAVKLAELLYLYYLETSHRLVSITAYCLGLVFLLGLYLCPSSFGIYLSFLAFFHFSEYVATGLGNPQNLSFDSYLVNHSAQYGLAMLVSWLELWLGVWLVPGWKYQPLVTGAGVMLCLLGETVRKAAMLEAGRSFNHLVQSTKSEDHQLVTSGVYSWCRHPSYAGWFLWSLGSQLILVNPVCLALYGWVSFSFFKERIYVEEYTLLQFFGQEYRDYQEKVGPGIPGIKGFEGPISQVVWGAGDQHQD